MSIKIFISDHDPINIKMNVVPYSRNQSQICYLIVDNTSEIKDLYHRELMKNLADYTISNIYGEGYDVFVSLDVDTLLEHVSDTYSHAVVLSTGTEFINGNSFFKQVEELTKNDYFVYGHILDRKEAYYELHHQCFLINLKKYNDLNKPRIGSQELGSSHTQTKPLRSLENIHDDYTPLSIVEGTETVTHSHKLHGYNLISVGLKSGYTINAWAQDIRNNKKYYYPENNSVFLQEIAWAYLRYNYCMTEFVHTGHTEVLDVHDTYDQLIITASGLDLLKYLNTNGNVIVYDYNQKALDYYKQLIKLDNVEFVQIDLMGISDVSKLVKYPEKKTLINLSNIFCYEGTMMFSSLKYRLSRENMLLSQLPSSWEKRFSQRSCQGFTDINEGIIELSSLRTPTWHMDGSWK